MSTKLVTTETEIEGVTEVEVDTQVEVSTSVEPDQYKSGTRWIYLKNGVFSTDKTGSPLFICSRCLIRQLSRPKQKGLCSCGGFLRRLY